MDGSSFFANLGMRPVRKDDIQHDAFVADGNGVLQPEQATKSKRKKPDPEKTTIKKADDELQIVWGEVYIPMIPDSQGDFMTAVEIRKMAYNFLASGHLDNIDVNHDNKQYGCYVVESFIARDDDPVFVPGSWVMAVHIPNPEIWALVKSGELNGFSLQAEALGEHKTLVIDLPEKLIGKTDDADGHSHKFTVAFDDKGQISGGATDLADGHFHLIKRGTITEPAGLDGHTHRFHIVDGLVDAAA